MPEPVRLTTTAKVQELLQLPALNAQQAALLESFIAGVSAAFARELDRAIETAERVEYLDGDPENCWYSLRAFPVSEVASVEVDATGKWDGDETTLDEALWRALLDPEEHLLYVEGGVPCGPRTLRVTYTGGLGETTAAVMAAFPDLAMAATLEVANLHQRRTTLSIQAIGTVGADNQLLISLAKLPLTREILARMRR